MPLTATIITDRNMAEPPWIKRSGLDTIAQRNYLVNTHEEEVAITAVPPINSIWSIGFPGLILYSQFSRYYARKDASASGGDPSLGGLTIVQCDYAIPRSGGISPPPAIGLKYTDLEFGDETQTLKFDLLSQTQAGVWLPINNGEGVGKVQGTIKAKIYTYTAASQPIPLSRISQLTRAKALNNAPLTLPAIYGTAASFNMLVGEVRYEGIDKPSVSNGIRELVHNVSLAEDWFFRWNQEDSIGNASTSVTSTVYPMDDLTGLW